MSGANVCAEDPFSRSFSSPTSSTGSDFSVMDSNNQPIDDGIHPMMRYDLSKYFVKGTLDSSNGSLAIVSLPGDKDYILFLGDPLGNDMHTIKDISQDFIILGKSTGEDVTISVMNVMQKNIGLN